MKKIMTSRKFFDTGPAQQIFEWGGGGAKDEHVSQIGVGGGNA